MINKSDKAEMLNVRVGRAQFMSTRDSLLNFINRCMQNIAVDSYNIQSECSYYCRREHILRHKSIRLDISSEPLCISFLGCRKLFRNLVHTREKKRLRRSPFVLVQQKHPPLLITKSFGTLIKWADLSLNLPWRSGATNATNTKSFILLWRPGIKWDEHKQFVQLYI